MSHSITTWTLPGCSRCEAVKARFAGHEVEERPLEAARRGEDPDAVDVMAQLAYQDHEVPVVRVDGQFMSPAEAIKRRES
ncbi:MAG TPA: hypothetical protein P5532_12845 [Planctomycetota bacterium]|nr:hypothetical protein [Planctomycetota bacterium]HRT95308.1 hypothetical protein [Planctomycetota bacterium]